MYYNSIDLWGLHTDGRAGVVGTGCPTTGVASIATAIETLKVAELLTPLLTEQLQAASSPRM